MVWPSGPDLQLTVAGGYTRQVFWGKLGRASWRLKCHKSLALDNLTRTVIIPTAAKSTHHPVPLIVVTWTRMA